MDEELKTFKAMIRHVAKHEGEAKAGKWFQADNRPRLRRLGFFGINRHQPAIAAYCKQIEKEKEEVANAIMKQKVANNPKAEKQLAEHRELNKGNQNRSYLIRIARIAVGATVRWQRKITARSSSDRSPEEGDGIAERVLYQTRMIACTRCVEQQETKAKQLKVSAGFRAIHCKRCGRQENVSTNKCSCNIIWHQCMLHNIDPLVHLPNKGQKWKAARREEPGKKIILQSSSRKAPNVIEGNGEDAIAKQRKGERKRKNGSYDIRPNQVLIERVRGKQAKRKAEEDLIGYKPSKAACEREERIAEVQLKASWTCFPMTLGAAD